MASESLANWHLYVVECADGSLYTGITTDLTRRVHEHNSTARGAKYTRSRRPVRLVYSREYADRSTASKAEAGFKKLSRQEKVARINETD